MKPNNFRLSLCRLIPGALLLLSCAGQSSLSSFPSSEGSLSDDQRTSLSSSGSSASSTDSGEAEQFSILAASGDANCLYLEFAKAAGADGYKAYVRAEGESDWQRLDNELLRDYGSYMRLDALGLRPGRHEVMVEAIAKGAVSQSLTSAPLSVSAYSREGFAFHDGHLPGAYQKDGTLKPGALVLYVSDANSSTIACEIQVDAKGKKEKAEGIQAILTLLKKGQEKRPLAVRFLGDVHTPEDFSSPKNASICKGDLVLDGNGKYQAGITIEGVGNDAYFNGFGLRLKNISDAEVRNLGFLRCRSAEGDEVGLQQGNDHIYVHHCDFFYGEAGKDADQAKGDGSLDCKKSNYVSFSYNHFFDSGKCNLLGLSEKSGDYYATYDHNWYDHSDSRHPRIRYYSAHVYNNYYDGNAKYGLGACLGSSVFAEENYFRNCRYPLLTSMQGRDYKNSLQNHGKGMFSNEDGGSIKAFHNLIEGGTAPLYYAPELDSDGWDAYQAQTREEKIPDSLRSKQGNNAYNNFDASAALPPVDQAADVPMIVTAKAGRLQRGDFRWSFDNGKDDADYGINPALKEALWNYQSKLRSIGGLAE